MPEPKDIEIALKQNDVSKIKEFIKTGGNIYKEFEKEQYFYARETLMARACREKKTEIVEILLDVYERDYKVAEQFVSKENEFVLKYVFIAWTEEEINQVLDLFKKSESGSKKVLVFLADRQECVLISIDKGLMSQLYKNGPMTINTRDRCGANPGHLIGAINRLDLLKRMIEIGLNFKDTLPGIDNYNHNLVEIVIGQSKCIGLIKYCLNELNLEHEDLLKFTAKNKSIKIFEFVLEYICAKNGSTDKKDYLLKYFEKNLEFFENFTDSGNYKLLAHIFTVYHIRFEKKSIFFNNFFKLQSSAEYIEKILEIEKDSYDDLLDSIDVDTDSFVLYEIWRTLDKSTLKKVNKNNVRLIVFTYESPQKCYQSEARDNLQMIDPLAIYDKEKGNTALILALELNCAVLIRYLICKGADLLHRNKEGHTILTAACQYSTIDIIQYILKAEPTLNNKVGRSGYYPLTELIYRDETFVDVFQEILKSGADFLIQDEDKHTLLHLAVLCQSFELVKICLNLGIDPSITESKENTALHLSAKAKSLEIFDLILSTGKVDVESKNYRGYTILHCASKSCFPYFLDSLAKKTNPNVNARDNVGRTALYYCYDNQRYKQILEMGADTSIVGDCNLPFYSKVASIWKLEILQEVFSNPQIDLTITSDDGQTILHFLPNFDFSIDEYLKNENFKEMFRKCTNTMSRTSSAFFSAACTGNLSVMKYMFEYGEPQLEKTNYIGETPIFGNLRYRFHKDMLEFLIEKGANVNAQNDKGNSIIFESVYAEGTEILLKAGASTVILNKKGESALHLAAQRNDLEICLLLLSYGGDVNLDNEDNKKPSDLSTYRYLKDFLLYISD